MRLSSEFGRLASACSGSHVSLRRLLPAMSPRDHALLTLFISVCFLHPIPMPGLSTMLGLLILLAGSRMSLGLGPYIPRRWLDRPLPAQALRRIFSSAETLMKRLERVIRPRGRALASSAWLGRVNGAAIASCGLLIMIPLPPPTNFPPATALLLLSTGVLEEDALFLALGYLALAGNFLLFGYILTFGYDGLRALLEGGIW